MGFLLENILKIIDMIVKTLQNWAFFARKDEATILEIN